MDSMILKGALCSCTLSDTRLTIQGTYYQLDLHKRRQISKRTTVELSDVLRVGITKTYSRFMFLIPMLFGILSLLVKAIPSAEFKYEIIPGVYSVEHTFWSFPFQDNIWRICGGICLLTMPLYWLSYRNDLEINTTNGRFLLPRKGMSTKQIMTFQQAVLTKYHNK